MNPLEQLEDEVKMSALARVDVAKMWTSCVTLAVFCVCTTVLAIGLVAIIHG